MAQTERTETSAFSAPNVLLDASVRIQHAMIRASLHWFEETAGFGAVMLNKQLDAMKRLASCTSAEEILHEQAKIADETFADVSQEVPRLYSISQEALADTEADAA